MIYCQEERIIHTRRRTHAEVVRWINEHKYDRAVYCVESEYSKRGTLEHLAVEYRKIPVMNSPVFAF